MSVERQRVLRAAAAIAAVYTAFLLCAQFGFLAQLADRLGSDSALLRAVLAAMGGGGVAGSLLAALRGRRPVREAARARLALFAVAAAAAASIGASGALTSAVAAAALGGTLGFATVSLAGDLPALVPAGQTGRAAGLGTGLAYAISNLPPLFAGPPAVRALAPAALCLLAAIWPPLGVERGGIDPEPSEPAWRFVALVAAFAALVAVDSAAFAHVQATPQLAAASWAGSANQLRQGGAHLLAALAAGELLDRGGLRTLLAVTAGIFVVAIPALPRVEVQAGAAVLYAIGISIYSAALVAAPSLSGTAARSRQRAAWIYVVAGWAASGIGVAAGHAGAFRQVAMFAALGGGLCLATEVVRRRALVRALGPAAALGALVAAGSLLVPADAARGSSDLVARGRAVYLAEGCQHCHSQYVRPDSGDELWWGPRRALDRTERPPTPGNRRIGPDLANVGLRRSELWQGIHLRDPRAFSPRSRMPPYAHLFAPGSDAGPALVAYLGSLGAGHEAERDATVASWRGAPASSGDAGRGAALFARHCAACHGPQGKGDGAAARGFTRPTMDLTRGSFARAIPVRDDESPDAALGRVIRFGLPPGTMAGHEWLSDREVADLVAFVRQLPFCGAAGAGESR